MLCVMFTMVVLELLEEAEVGWYLYLLGYQILLLHYLALLLGYQILLLRYLALLLGYWDSLPVD